MLYKNGLKFFKIGKNLFLMKKQKTYLIKFNNYFFCNKPQSEQLNKLEQFEWITDNC